MLLLAAARIGAVVNPLLPICSAPASSASSCASRGRRVLVIPGRFRGCDYPRADRRPARRPAGAARGAGGARPRRRRRCAPSPFRHAAGAARRRPPSRRQPSRRSLLLMYTSGTTAEPKGVLHTHDTLIAEVQSLARMHASTPRDRTLMPSPLTHISGVIHAILAPALLGTSAVLMERWDPGEGLELIARERVTYMVGAPTFLQDLAEHPARHGRRHLALPPLLVRRGRRRRRPHARGRGALGCVAKRVYGSTEFPTITTTDAADAADARHRDRRPPDRPGRAAHRRRAAARSPPAARARSRRAARSASSATATPRSTPTRSPPTAGSAPATSARSTPPAICASPAGSRTSSSARARSSASRELEELVARHPSVAEVAVVALPDPHRRARLRRTARTPGCQPPTLEEIAIP